MQNCPITTSPYGRCVFFTLPNSTAGGLLLQDCTRALYQTTRQRPWRGLRIFLCGSGYQTLRRGAFTTRLYEGTLPDYAEEARGVRLRILWGKKWGGFCPYSLTTRLHGRERQNNKLLRFRLPLFASYSTCQAKNV